MRSFLKNSDPLSFSLLALLLVAVNGCAVDPASRDTPDRRTAAVTGQPESATFSGNFLAGRFAQQSQDWDAASRYMNAALAFDPGNNLMKQRVFLLTLGAGDTDRTRSLAQEILKSDPGQELALIFLAADAIAKADYTTAEELAARLPEQGFGQYTKPVLTAWAMAGDGRTDDALALLSRHVEADDPTFDLHMALIAERSGRTEEADKYFRQVAAKGLTMQTAILAAKFYERHDEGAKARQIYESLDKTFPFNPFVNAVEASGSQDSSAFISPADGVAIGLFEIANALYDRRAFDSAQIYARIVTTLNPQLPTAQLLLGDLAAIHKNDTLAANHYQSISPQSPVYTLAQMRLADLMEAKGDISGAEEMLVGLSQTPGMEDQALVSLGDFYRRTSQFGKAVNVYDTVLSRTDRKNPNYWAVLYARGMSLEKSNDWARAEKDLMTALDLQPENPMILNFIGYTWLEKGINLDQALNYTQKAALLRPNDGYIIDSYGFALYRTRHFEQAVKALERAASLIPDDAEVLNHLGDAYWQVGRHQEARYKWKRAIEMTTDARLKSSLARKMEKGIDDFPTAQAAAPANKL